MYYYFVCKKKIHECSYTLSSKQNRLHFLVTFMLVTTLLENINQMTSLLFVHFLLLTNF